MKTKRHFILDENFDYKIIKDLSNNELKDLSDDIKELIISRCSEFGGHLSSNLGITNLTISLFKCFDVEKDKIIFDIGHNSYAYKILTGRPLKNLRQKNGTDGFQRIKESKFDVYDAGHSSTSISAALGFAKSRDLLKENYNVVCIVGDGSLENGLCLEALNNLVIANTKIIIILNDNEMSISPTTGGISAILKGIRKNPFVHAIFNDANFEYFGPVDGDSFKDLKKAIEKAKKAKNSVLLHVKTSKGEGYQKAEEDIVGEYHFVQPFDIKTGKIKNKVASNVISFSKIFSDLVDEDLENNEKTIVICPSTTVGAKLNDVFKKYPDRTFDVGISEEHAAVYSSAFAMNGFHTYLFMYSTFLQRAYDEVIHDICRLNQHVTLCIDRSGLTGQDGETHQGIYDDGFFFSMPNLVLAMPKDKYDAKRLFDFSKNYKHPFAIRYPAIYEENGVAIKTEPITELNWDILLDNSLEKVVVSFGPRINELYEALKNKNISLINALFLKDYNIENVKNLLKYKSIYIYDPYGIESGFASNLLLNLNKFNYKGDVKIKTLPVSFIEKGTIKEQEKEFLIDLESSLQWILS